MPTRDTPWPDGTPCWIDYGAADLDAAKAFYADAARLGRTPASDPEYGGYLNALMRRPAGGRHGPAAWTRTTRRAGRPTSPPTTPAAAGADHATPAARSSSSRWRSARWARWSSRSTRRATPFGLWQSGSTPASGSTTSPARWPGTRPRSTTRRRRATSTRAVFGFRFDEMPEMPAATPPSADRRRTPARRARWARRPASPKGWRPASRSPPTDEAVAAVEAARRQGDAWPPMDTAFGRFAVVEDPWGAPFAVMQDPPAS